MGKGFIFIGGSQMSQENDASTPKDVPLRVFTVLRVKDHPDRGTFGVFIDEDEGLPFAVTIERLPIPEGEYILKRDYYHAGKYVVFEITGIPGRDRVLIHRGNIDDHSKGCVIIGESFSPIYLEKEKRWDYGVLASGAAFQEFMEKLKGRDQAKLIIARWRPK